MSFFNFFKSNKQNQTINDSQKSNDAKKEKLDYNCGVEFTTEIKDDRNDNEEELRYSYTDVECSDLGNLEGLSRGAVLYVRRNGILANVCGENILEIKNEKIKSMVNDFFDKSKFSTLRAKYVSSTDNIAQINIGFFISYSKDDDSEFEDNE